jgi:hypothetical protein
VARRLPHCEGRRRESRVGEIANGNADEPWKPGVLPKQSGPAHRTEMKGHGLPLSAVRFHSVDFPEMVTWSLRKRAWLLITAPVRRWQAKQWHMALREGSPSIVRWSCPQLQAAWRVIVRLHNTGVQGYWSGALSRIRPKARETAPPARCSWKTLQIAPSYPRARGSTNPICTGVTGGVVLKESKQIRWSSQRSGCTGSHPLGCCLARTRPRIR